MIKAKKHITRSSFEVDSREVVYKSDALLALEIAEKELRKEIVDKLQVAVGVMILEGYDEFDACVKIVNELINEIKKPRKK